MHAIELLSLQPWVERLGWTILQFLWQGVLISAAYAVARRCVTRPEHRYLLACAALAAMMAAPLVTFGVKRQDTPLPGGPAPVAAHLADTVPSAASNVINMLPASVGVWPEQSLTWIVVIWLVGAVAFWMRLMGGWVVATRMRSMLVRPAPPEWQRTLDSLKARIGLSLPVRLLVSALVQVPSVVGWLRPVVLVPIGALAGLPPEHVEALLLHELAHIRRRDYLVNMLQGVAESLLFYHPAVWWVSGHIRTERELCFDDLAVSAGGGVLTYARALVELESFRPAHFNTAMAANGGSLTHRIGRLLSQSPAVSRTLSGPGVAVSAALLVVTACAVFGQSAERPRFDVTSVRPCKDYVPLGARAGGGISSPETLDINCQTLKGLIQAAYVIFASGVRPAPNLIEIEGGPKWIDSERYSIKAKAEGVSSQAMMHGPMLQALLEDRFKVKVHHETREVPIYILSVAKGGPKLEPFKEGTCNPYDITATFPPPPPPENPCHNRGTVNNGVLTMETQAMTLDDFARSTLGVMDRPVINKTGIQGRFNFHLEYTPDETSSAGRPVDPGVAEVSIFSAVQQLGLKLEPAKGPGDYLVIDHAEKPSEN